jgi:hypothetical protein
VLLQSDATALDHRIRQSRGLRETGDANLTACPRNRQQLIY